MDNAQSNQKRNNPPRRMSDIELVVVSTKKLESRLVTELGDSKYNPDRSNTTFFDKLRQVEHLFTAEDQERFRYVSMVRNIIVHDPKENRINDRNKFEHTVNSLNLAFETAKKNQLIYSNTYTTSTNTYTEPTSTDKNPFSGCFIATAIYGDYDHSQVIVLRQFRDNKLLTNRFGKVFVKIYYIISPPIAGILRENKTLAKPVRRILDKIIEIIKH